MFITEKYIKNIITDKKVKNLAYIFGVKNYQKGFVYGPHKHNRIEINFVQFGTCTMQFGNEIVRFNKNDCMIIYPNVEHYFNVDKSSASLVQLEFTMNVFPELKPAPRLKKQLVFLHNILTNSQKYIKIINNQQLNNLIILAVKELNKKEENFSLMTRLYYAQLFLYISRYIKTTLTFSNSNNNKYVEQAVRLINNGFEENINLDKIADNCGISLRYLRTLFNEYLHMSPIDYIQVLRMSKAKELMNNETLSLKEIAYSSGFSNQQYFTRQFVKTTGMTPAIYQKKLFRKV